MTMHIPGNKPVLIFKNAEELNDCIKWWKERLFLQEWSISGEIKDLVLTADNKETSGANFFDFTLMHSTIYLSKISDEEIEEGISNAMCQELTLVHELLHLRLNLFHEDKDFGSVYMDYFEHQNLEKFARTLIMLKYGLTLDWFEGIYVKEAG